MWMHKDNSFEIVDRFGQEAYARQYYQNYLAHHGILGMKWGVRRFQNKDGTLTPEGRARLEKLSNSGSNNNRLSMINAQKAKAGVSSKNGYDVIKKGASIQRIADSGEKLDSKRKYVSLLYDDNETYSSEIGTMLGGSHNESLQKYTYQAKKDLKVAQSKEVYDYIAEKYGKGAVKSFDELDAEMKFLSAANGIDPIGLNKIDKALVKNACDNYFKGRSEVYHFLNDTLYMNKSINDDVMKHFEKAGYDAIVDVQDQLGGIADYPVIVINPEKSMKLVKSERW